MRGEHTASKRPWRGVQMNRNEPPASGNNAIKPRPPQPLPVAASPTSELISAAEALATPRAAETSSETSSRRLPGPPCLEHCSDVPVTIQGGLQL